MKKLLCLILLIIFMPLISNEAPRYPLHIYGAASRSAVMCIWGSACGAIEYKMISDTLHVWNENDCEQEYFYTTTGYWWAKEVCSGNRCIEVMIP